MVDYKYRDLFLDDSVPKRVTISADTAVLTNEDLYNQEMTLEESLCSEEELRFGCCEASVLKFKTSDIFSPMIGKWLDVKMVIDGHSDAPFPIGRYKVASDKLTSDRRYRDIVAYDAMYDIINADVAAWYNSALPDKESTVTMKQFRESFIRHFGLTEVLPQVGTEESGTPIYGLVNDGMEVGRTIDPEQISGKDIITAICEINGCFGHIGRDGKFHYIYLPQNIQGLYPANDLYPDHAPDYLPYQQRTGHLYPQDPKGERIGKGLYIECDYEDFITQDINRIQIRQEENDIGCVYPGGVQEQGDNLYIVEDNFIVYGKSASDLENIAANLYKKISNISYIPMKSLDMKGNPCFELGDPIWLFTKYKIIETYILKRTLHGIQALRDNFSADGVLEYGEQMNSVSKSIVQLKGKTNTLARNVDETKAELKDTEKSLRSTITQTASEIRAEVEDGDRKLSSTISQTAAEIRTEVSDLEKDTATKFSQTADAITAEVARAKDSEAKLGIRADQITLSVSDLRKDTEAEFRVMSNRISLKVEAGEVQSMIDVSLDKIVLRSDQIQLEGYTTINGGFSIDEQGNATISSGDSSLKLTDGDLIIREGGRIIASVGGAYGNTGIYLDNHVVARSEGSYLVFSDGSGYGYFKRLYATGQCEFGDVQCGELVVRGYGNIGLRVSNIESDIIDIKERLDALESKGGGGEE